MTLLRRNLGTRGRKGAALMAERTWQRALVTGASSGIGAAFCRELAAEGTDLVVVARDRARLTSLGEALGAEHSVKAEVLAADLADSLGLDEVAARIGDLGEPVDLVVNNAGFAISGDIAEVTADDIQAQIDLNISALARLTRSAIVAMVPQGRGSIVNIASLAGLAPGPGIATYSATKAFVSSLGASLAAELSGTGVTLTTVHPGFTRTEFQERSGYDPSRLPAVLWQRADEVAAEALRAARAGRSSVVTGIPNRVTASLLGFVPRSLQARAVRTLSRVI